ncbi:MAG: hypothetical protein K0S07_1706 [Chlamydiales bacterium]|jgi:hypothetical protein|nr:hypothetical protein [Chlamydiales bacterium]
MGKNTLFGLLFFISASCTDERAKESRPKAQKILRTQSEQWFKIDPPQLKSPPSYPWQQTKEKEGGKSAGLNIDKG